MKGEQIETIEELAICANLKLSVIIPSQGVRRSPAAFILNWKGSQLVRLFRAGMFVYKNDRIYIDTTKIKPHERRNTISAR
jgi:hypothetical protein